MDFPTTRERLVQVLSHHYLAAFDNLEEVPKNARSFLCEAVTGTGFSKRQLFSDDTDMLYEFHRSFILNGVGISVQLWDLLLERSLLFELPEAPDPKDRIAEARIFKNFYNIQPSIVGGAFDSISKVTCPPKSGPGSGLVCGSIWASMGGQDEAQAVQC